VADAAACSTRWPAPCRGSRSSPRPPRPAATFPRRFARRSSSRPDRPLRVGRYLTPLLADVAVDADVVTAWEAASAQLAALGCEIVDVDPPLGPAAEESFLALWECSRSRPFRRPSSPPCSR